MRTCAIKRSKVKVEKQLNSVAVGTCPSSFVELHAVDNY